MTIEEPRPAELSRRIDDVGKQITDLRSEMSQRFDRMPTTDIMLAYLATRDLEVKTLAEDIKELVAAQTQERAERLAADETEKTARDAAVRDLAGKVESDRRYARGFALSVIAALVAIVGVVVNAGGFG